jgi:hypothetical protein
MKITRALLKELSLSAGTKHTRKIKFIIVCYYLITFNKNKVAF